MYSEAPASRVEKMWREARGRGSPGPLPVWPGAGHGRGGRPVYANMGAVLGRREGAKEGLKEGKGKEKELKEEKVSNSSKISEDSTSETPEASEDIPVIQSMRSKTSLYPINSKLRDWNQMQALRRLGMRLSMMQQFTPKYSGKEPSAVAMLPNGKTITLSPRPNTKKKRRPLVPARVSLLKLVLTKNLDLNELGRIKKGITDGGMGASLPVPAPPKVKVTLKAASGKRISFTPRAIWIKVPPALPLGTPEYRRLFPASDEIVISPAIAAAIYLKVSKLEGYVKAPVSNQAGTSSHPLSYLLQFS